MMSIEPESLRKKYNKFLQPGEPCSQGILIKRGPIALKRAFWKPSRMLLLTSTTNGPVLSARRSNFAMPFQGIAA